MIKEESRLLLVLAEDLEDGKWSKYSSMALENGESEELYLTRDQIESIIEYAKRLNEEGCLKLKSITSGKVKLGDEFGKLTVIGLHGKVCDNDYWECKCECHGKNRIRLVRETDLLSGHTVSCGCKVKSKKI